jgi:polysaccharide biosynthesis protein PelA
LRTRSPRLWLSAVAAALTLFPVSAVFSASAAAAPRAARLRHVHSWAFAIGDGDLSGDVVARYSDYDLVVVDGQEATARQVDGLRRAGKIVLAYLDVGTIEPGRPWYAVARRYRLGYWPDWGEWYANVASPGFRRLIRRSVAPGMLRKRFDGLFLDNTDMIETHPRQVRGMRTLVRGLGRLAHGEGKLLFAQNGEDSIGPLLSVYDGWNREDVLATYDFARHRYLRQPRAEVAAADRALRRIARAGLLTLATDYVAAGDAAGTRAAIANACGAGAVPFVSDIDLTRVPVIAPRCG